MAGAKNSNARPNEDAAGRGSRQDDAIIEAAWCYYHEGLNQFEIAHRLNLSRASVVNYLAEARKRDYVRISLDSDVFRNQRLSSELKTRFNLTNVLVVPADELSDERSSERVIRAASDWLPHLLEPGDHLGVAWGETIHRLAQIAPKLALSDLTVVQLTGSKPAELGFAAENCAAALAQRFGAQCINLHVPLLLTSARLAAELRAEPMIAVELQMIADCNKVLFACGTTDPQSHIARIGLIDAENLAEMRANGATGVICGRTIDKDGIPIRAPNEDQMIGVSLEQIRNKQMRIFVSAGIERVDSALAALRGGYATHFVTCSETATQLLQKA